MSFRVERSGTWKSLESWLRSDSGGISRSFVARNVMSRLNSDNVCYFPSHPLTAVPTPHGLRITAVRRDLAAMAWSWLTPMYCTARIPHRLRPAISVRNKSPMWTASAGAAPERAERDQKSEGWGLLRPTSSEKVKMVK